MQANSLPIYIWAGNNFQANDLARCLGLRPSEFRILNCANQVHGSREATILTYGYYYRNREIDKIWAIGNANRCNFINVGAINANTIEYVKTKLGELNGLK